MLHDRLPVAIVNLLLLVVALAAKDAPVTGFLEARRATREATDLESLQTLVLTQAETLDTVQTLLESQKNKMAEMEESFQSQLSELGASIETLTSQIQALESKVNSTARSVAFTAEFSRDPVGNIGAHSILVFDHAITNIGNGYDPNTGVFTAPVAGLYVFYISIMLTAEQTAFFHVAIETAEGVVDMVTGHSQPLDQGTSMVTVHLGRGEQLWTRHDDGNPSSLRGSYWTVFSGFLAHADLI